LTETKKQGYKKKRKQSKPHRENDIRRYNLFICLPVVFCEALVEKDSHLLHNAKMNVGEDAERGKSSKQKTRNFKRKNEKKSNTERIKSYVDFPDSPAPKRRIFIS